MFDVITIGSATRDVFLVSDKFIALKSKRFPTGAGECVALGSKIDVDELVLTTGGGATNAAATLASLGLHTATMTRIGDDSTGKDIVDDLSRFGVSTHFVRMVKGGQSAFSVLLTMKNGERTVLVYRGVSAAFEPKDVHWEGCKQTKWIYLTSLGGNIALSKKIIRHAAQCGVKVFWNPGKAELHAGMNALAPVLAQVDVLTMNLEEAKLLTGKRTTAAMLQALSLSGKIRLITNGTDGSYAWYEKQILHAGTSGVKAISRTGAGDAFGSGFLAGLIKQNDVRYALTLGTLNAESVITEHGAKNGILTSWPSASAIQKIQIL
ncbi:carbohydrate kinase family protein [Candidatus Parcubacteria bacterium]|nr:carbohydrate kinase family protein [Candidatus Parcubacteria bacterium]